ncbi:MAG TPA: TIGR02270 family protein [Archangium sp.]|nr:TIGR02270 family protein [Archangium sp.]
MRTELVINWDHYEEHLDEAAFLWSQWEHALVAPDQVLSEVADTEERLFARLDGLVLGGTPVTERLLLPALESDEPERVTAATYTLLSQEFPGGAELVRAALDTATPPTLAAVQRALEVSEKGALLAWLPDLLEFEAPALQALALDVLCSQGRDTGVALARLLKHEEPRVVAAALRLSARLNHRLERDFLERVLASPSPAVRDAAIEAGLLGNHRAAWLMCRAVVEGRAPQLRFPALLLALGGNEQDLSLLRRLLSVPEHRPDVLWALGFSGQPVCADACLEWMEDDEVARLAAEAFCAITGLRLEGRFVDSPEEEGDVLVALEEEDLDADLSSKPEDALPYPRAAVVAAWWEEERHKRFSPGQRYLYGRPFSPEWLLEVSERAPMRRRHALALDVALRSRGLIRIPTRTFTHHTQAALLAARSAPMSRLSRLFTEGLYT